MFLKPTKSIGIDPGKSTGFAVYCLDKKDLVQLETLDFWKAFEEVLKFHPVALSRVVIEVPNTKHVWQAKASSDRALQRQGVNVGSVIREAELLAEGLERKGYPVKRVQPRKKINATEFNKFTGWSGRTNQHCRDAAMMCWGR